MVRQDQPQQARSTFNLPMAASLNQPVPAGYSSKQPAAEWNKVLAALGELGFQSQQSAPPPAAEVVLAAQLRLRYWRRQLPCGWVSRCCCDDGNSQWPAAAVMLRCGEQLEPAVSQGQEASDPSFVQQRIRSIKSARDCLLACSRQAVRATFATD